MNREREIKRKQFNNVYTLILCNYRSTISTTEEDSEQENATEDTQDDDKPPEEKMNAYVISINSFSPGWLLH